MLSAILVPLDGSALAEQALSYATRIARQAGATLLLVRAAANVDVASASQTTAGSASPSGAFLDELDARSYLSGIAARLQAEGLSVETYVQPGDAAEVILDVARNRSAELVVMSTHGRGGFGRWLYGSVADQVLRQSTVPVLLTTVACKAPWPEDRRLRILVPLDGSPLAETALGPMGGLAALLGADVLLLRVIEPVPLRVRAQAPRVVESYLRTEHTEGLGYLRLVGNGLQSRGLSTSMRIAVGDPAFSIVSIAREQGVDIIAMATHGSGGLSRLIMGSVGTETLQRASVPLLLVRPTVASPMTVETTAHELAPSARVVVPSVDVPLNQYELGLLLRGLGELLYAPDRDARLVEPARELLLRLRQVERDLFEENEDPRASG